jgi:hypothetical protein
MLMVDEFLLLETRHGYLWCPTPFMKLFLKISRNLSKLQRDLFSKTQSKITTKCHGEQKNNKKSVNFKRFVLFSREQSCSTKNFEKVVFN